MFFTFSGLGKVESIPREWCDQKQPLSVFQQFCLADVEIGYDLYDLKKDARQQNSSTLVFSSPRRPGNIKTFDKMMIEGERRAKLLDTKL